MCCIHICTDTTCTDMHTNTGAFRRESHPTQALCDSKNHASPQFRAIINYLACLLMVEAQKSRENDQINKINQAIALF